MKESQSSGLTYLFRNRKLFGIALFVGAVLGLSLTFFVPKKYLSTAIIYPYNSHTRGDLVANPQFGFEVETEQLLQLLESKSMRDRTIEKFKLYEYYELDTTSKAWNAELSTKYIDDISFFRSKYLSVVIHATLKDPELAADIANFQVDEINDYRESIFKENREAEFRAIESEYDISRDELQKLKDSIYALSPSNGLLYNFMENLNNENFDPSDFVTDPRMEDVVEQYVYESNKYKSLRNKYDQMKNALKEPLPSVYSIDVAVPSHKKVSPSFSVNIAIGAMLVFFITLTARLVLDKWKELRSNNL